MTTIVNLNERRAQEQAEAEIKRQQEAQRQKEIDDAIFKLDVLFAEHRRRKMEGPQN